MKGYVYVMSNPAYARGLIKVGQSSLDPEERRRTLSSETAVPEPFVIEYWALVENYETVEREVHRVLNEFRNSQKREFFTCDVQTAIKAIKETATVLLDDASGSAGGFSQSSVMAELKANNEAYFEREEQKGRRAAAELRARLEAAEKRESRRAKKSILDRLLYGKYQPQFSEEELFLKKFLSQPHTAKCFYDVRNATSLEDMQRVHIHHIFEYEEMPIGILTFRA